jgi:glutathione peroxidase
MIPARSTILVLAVALSAACAKEPRTPAPRPSAEGGGSVPADLADPTDSRPTHPAGNYPEVSMDTVFSSPIKSLDGQPSSLAAHAGKALLLVNVASKCGLTPQYAELEKLHNEYSGRGFAVLGFPCNQFGGQEPGTADDIKAFCSTTYGVTFPMFEKIDVNGEGRHPIYKELTQVRDAAGTAGDIQWNFEKFVISADRQQVHRFRPRTLPYDPAIIAAVEAGLPK